MQPATTALGIRILVSSLALSGLVGACAPAGPSAMAVEIAGPASVAPGQSAQFTAIDKASSRPAPDARWTSSAPSVLQVGPTGLATAGIPGEAVLSVDVPSPPRRASREILVLPDGTYRLIGRVTEGSTGTVAVPDARVEARLEADGRRRRLPSRPPPTTAGTGSTASLARVTSASPERATSRPPNASISRRTAHATSTLSGTPGSRSPAPTCW